MNLVRFLFIASIAALLWHHKAAENPRSSKLSGYYETGDIPISPKFALKFIDDHQVQIYADGKIIGSAETNCTYKIEGNNVAVKHECGTWNMEIQGDVLYKNDDGWRFRLRK